MKNKSFRFGFFLLIAVFGLSFGGEKKQKPAEDPEIYRKVEDLLAQMTLEEKIGQMTNIGLTAICEGEFWNDSDSLKLDTAKMNKMLLRYHIGSIQNKGKYPPSKEEWHSLIRQIQEVAVHQSRLGIPVLYGIDAVHGANYTAGSTLFPHQIACAATWDPAFAEITGKITSYELKASGISWNYAPVLDVTKQPLWGRIFETYGEDTYLTTTMGEAFIRGAQGKSVGDTFSTAVCLKHFIGYGTPLSGKDRSSTVLPERIIRQYYLPPFQKAIEAGALTVMINSGSLNGVPSHADAYWMTTVLKEELQFKGFLISDWEDVVKLAGVHRVAADEKEAVEIAVNAGLDMCMDPYDESFAVLLAELVREGRVKESRIDDAVRRILYVKMKLGLFGNPLPDFALYPDFGSVSFAEESYRAAVECLTLLKNENAVLPLPQRAKILVTGPGAHSLNYLNGAWSRTWSGDDPAYNDLGKKTVLEALQDDLGSGQVRYVEGATCEKDVNTAMALRAAREADYIIACLGEKPATEKPSDIDDLTMPEAQLNLVRELSKSGKPIILVLLESRPRIIREIEPLCAAIIQAYLPGNEGGRALAAVLTGKENPSGKLPYTYPRFTGYLLPYDHTNSDQVDNNFTPGAFNPQFRFGSGLSYTTFSYSNLRISSDTLRGNDQLEVSVEVQNTGARKGKEVVQLYTVDRVAGISPAVQQLRRYRKIGLEPGGRETVRFTLDKEDLGFVGRDLDWVTEAGVFDIKIDTLIASFFYRP